MSVGRRRQSRDPARRQSRHIGAARNRTVKMDPAGQRRDYHPRFGERSTSLVFAPWGLRPLPRAGFRCTRVGSVASPLPPGFLRSRSRLRYRTNRKNHRHAEKSVKRRWIDDPSLRAKQVGSAASTSVVGAARPAYFSFRSLPLFLAAPPLPPPCIMVPASTPMAKMPKKMSAADS